MVEFVTVSRIFPSGSGQSAASINWTERLGAWGRICFRGMRKTRMVITMITMMTWWTWRLRTSSLLLCWGKSGYLLYVILPVAYLSEVEMITVCCFMCVFVRACVRAVVAGRCLKVLLERCPESRASRWVHAAIYFWGWCLQDRFRSGMPNMRHADHNLFSRWVQSSQLPGFATRETCRRRTFECILEHWSFILELIFFIICFGLFLYLPWNKNTFLTVFM